MAIPEITNEPIDISGIIGAAEDNQRSVEAAKDTLGKISDEHDLSVQKTVDAVQEDGQLAAEASQLLNTLKLNKQKRNSEAAAAFGTNMDAANSIVRAFGESIQEQHAALQEHGKKILEMQNTGFTDDPLEYVFNAFALPREIAAYNTREGILERDVKTMQELQNLTQEQVKVNEATMATTTAQVGAIESKRLVDQAIVRAENAKQEAARFGLQTMSVRQALDTASFNRVLAVHNAQVGLARLQLERDQKGISQEMLDLQKKNLQLLIDKREEDEQARVAFQGNLDKATALVGMRRITTNEWDRLPQKTKEALFDVMSDPNTASGRLGIDPVDALRNVERLNAPLTPNLKLVQDKLTAIAVRTMSKNPAWASMKTEQQNALLKKDMMEAVRQEAVNVPDSGGIYSAPPLAALRGIPAVTSTTIWKAALAPQALNPMHATSAQNIFDTATDLVSTNKMTIDQASKEVSQIYKAIAVDNSQQRDFNRFALPLQNNYRTNIRFGAGNVIDGQHSVDLANENEVRRLLMRFAAQKRAIGERYGFGHQ